MEILAKHIAFAQDTRCIDRRVMNYRDPVSLQRFCRGELNGLGYDFEVKRPRTGELEQLSKMTTIFACTLWLSSEWNEKSEFSKAAVLAHELVHAHQKILLGEYLFSWMYVSDPRWRWALEMQANRQQLAVMLNMGMSRLSALQRFWDLGHEIFREKYYMTRIDSRSLATETHDLGRRWIAEFFGNI